MHRIFAAGLTFLLLVPFFVTGQVQSCITISKNLSLGSRGPEVIKLQNFLISQNLLTSGSNSAYFGKLTQTAVQQWQKKNGIVSSGTPSTTGYGAVGAKTRKAMANCLVGMTPPPAAAPMSRVSPSPVTSPSPVAPSSPPIPSTIPPPPDSPTPLVTSEKSCTLDGISIQSGVSKKFYMVSLVSPSDSCDSVSQTRTCSNGTLGGSAAYAHASCAQASNVESIRKNLKDFLPYVYSTTWYPYFSNTVGVDPTRGLVLFKDEVARIKQQGFNTIWMGGVAIWKDLQPTPGSWDEARFKNLTDYLDVLQQNNMRAIYQLNYVGPGFAPSGIDGCTWFNDPAQVQKFTDFATQLGARLEKYNYMMYYMVYTEQTKACLIQLQRPYFYKGFVIRTVDTSDTVPNVAPYDTYHSQDVHAINQMLKASIGRFTKYMPKAVRNQMFIGIHDAMVSDGNITDDAPIEGPIDFDYISFPYYPVNAVVAAFPSDAILTGGDAPARADGYAKIIAALDESLANVRRFYPSVPILLGEFGWPDWSTATNNFVTAANSPARDLAHEAAIDWGITRRVGFNIWAWLPRFLDVPSQETVPFEDSLQLRMRDGSLSSVLNIVKKKLKGE